LSTIGRHATRSAKLDRVSSHETCAYCGKPTLTGDEAPEHVLPLAINSRLTTDAVCNPCNRWAGRYIDQPWLDDVFVGHARFVHQIPDRRGDVLTHDPFLAGTTADGTRIRMGDGGRPIALNSPVKRNKDTGEIQIHARSQDDLDRLLAREIRKAETAGKTFTRGEQRAFEEKPSVKGSHQIEPGVWERMAAKAVLGLLAKTQPSSWRASESANTLRAMLHNLDRPINEVDMRQAHIFHTVAPPPTSLVNIITIAGHAWAGVSLLGQFAFCFALADDLHGVDVAWVSDPLAPTCSALGTFAEVLGRRIQLDEATMTSDK
jgi:hypothetical protein